MSLTIAMVGFYGCQKEQLRENVDSNAEQPITKTTEEGDPTNAEELPDNPEECSTEGVTVKNGMLHFESMAAFEKVVGTLVNQPEQALDAWERKLGFTSLRTHNDILQQNPHVDDADMDSRRIPDLCFESLLNRGGRFRIDEKIYEVDMPKEVLNIRNLRNEIIEVRPIETKSSSAGCAANNSQWICSLELNGGNNKIQGKRWYIWVPGVYVAIGINTTYYRKNSWGNWKDEKAPKIWFYFGEKQRLVFYTGGAWRTINGPKIKSKDNNNNVHYHFWLEAGIGVQSICVCEYGGAMHYTYDIMVDCHSPIFKGC